MGLGCGQFLWVRLIYLRTDASVAVHDLEILTKKRRSRSRNRGIITVRVLTARNSLTATPIHSTSQRQDFLCLVPEVRTQTRQSFPFYKFYLPSESFKPHKYVGDLFSFFVVQHRRSSFLLLIILENQMSGKSFTVSFGEGAKEVLKSNYSHMGRNSATLLLARRDFCI